MLISRSCKIKLSQCTSVSKSSIVATHNIVISMQTSSQLPTHREEAGGNTCPGRLLRIYPSDELSFPTDGTCEACATITLTNNTLQCVAFKVKTTCPEKYRVRPSCGVIRPHCQCQVVVTLLAAYVSSNLARDKFLVMAIGLDRPEICHQELGEIWRDTAKERVMDYKLRCCMATNCPTMYNTNAQACPTDRCGGDTQEFANHQFRCLLDRIDCLRVEICFLRRLIVACLLLLMSIIFILFIMMRFGIEPFIVKQVVTNSCIGPNLA